MRCPVCESTVSSSLSFCPRCGARLGNPAGRARAAADGANNSAHSATEEDGPGGSAAVSGAAGASGTATVSRAASASKTASTPKAAASSETVTVSEAASVNLDDTAPLPLISEDENFLRNDNLSSHFTEAQEESKKRLPMVLIIVMFVLFLVAISTLAIATYYIIENYIEPIIRELTVPTIYDDNAEVDTGATLRDGGGQQDGATGTQLVQPPAPATTAPPAAPAAPTPPAGDGGGGTPVTPVATEDDPAKQAIYNNLLAAYRDAQAQDWQNALDSEYQDLVSLGAIMITHTDSNVSVSYDQVENGTVSYSYVDFGDDDTLDLAIAAVQDDGSYQLLGLFNTDGAGPISIMNGAVSTRSNWKVREDLTIESGGSLSAWEYRANVYEVAGSELTSVAAYGYDSYGYWSEDAEGNRTYISLEEYQELRNAASATLEWHPVSEFVEVAPDETEVTGSTTP